MPPPGTPPALNDVVPEVPDIVVHESAIGLLNPARRHDDQRHVEKNFTAQKTIFFFDQLSVQHTIPYPFEQQNVSGSKKGTLEKRGSPPDTHTRGSRVKAGYAWWRSGFRAHDTTHFFNEIRHKTPAGRLEQDKHLLKYNSK
jgi:hypothetical protein